MVFAYARYTSIFLVVLLYSPGIPFLFIIGLVGISMIFYTDKFLIFKFYKSKFNEDYLAKRTLKFLLLGIIFHFITSALMFTDPSLQR